MKLKKIICWPPLLGGVGAGVTIGILAYITFQSTLAGSVYGLWLAASFGSSVVVVFGYPDNEFAQPKNVIFGHLLCAFVGIIFVTLFKISQDRTIFFSYRYSCRSFRNVYDGIKNYSSASGGKYYCSNVSSRFVSIFNISSNGWSSYYRNRRSNL